MVNDNVFNQTISVNLELPDIWSCMLDIEKAAFWRFTAQDIRNLSHASPDFNRVCGAIREAERSRNAKRPINGLPAVTRALSVDDLQKAVVRLKEKLLDQPAIRSYLTRSFCRWLQQDKLQALLLVLDAVNCPRDEHGSLKGDIPEFSPTQAAQVICNLSRHEQVHDLVLCCGGLLINNHNWSSLKESFQALIEIAANSHSPILLMCNEGVMPTLPPAQDDARCSHISDMQIPDTNDAITVWGKVEQEFKSVTQVLGAETLRVADLKAAFESCELMQKMIVQLARCLSISHVSDAAFRGIEEIRKICVQIQNDLVNVREDDKAPTFEPVQALLKLVEFGDKLSDEEASLFGERVQKTFGQAVATAALRGKLSLTTEWSATECNKVSQRPNDLKLVECSKPKVNDPKELVYLDDVVGNSNPSIVSVVGSKESVAQNAQSPMEHTISSDLADDSPSIDTPFIGQVPQQIIECGASGGQACPEAGSIVECGDEPYSYVSFETYRSMHWVDDTGAVAPVSWFSEDYVKRMSQAILIAWDENQFALSYLFSRAAAANGIPPLLDIKELQCADRLLREPMNAVAAVDVDRVGRLQASIKLSSIEQTRTFGISVMLEALRPTHPCNLDALEIDRVLEIAAFKDPAIAEVAAFLLKGWASELDPLDLLRSRLSDDPDESIDVLKAALSKAQGELRAEVALLWSAAGGKIQRTHCRKAWTEFIQRKVVPIRDNLAPESGKMSSNSRWSPEKIRESVTQLGLAYVHIMDVEEVNYKDRVVANNAAEQIVSAM